MCVSPCCKLCMCVVCLNAGYDNLRQRIVEGGFMGVKAFFWADIDIPANDGSFRVFHGRCAPYQTW